MLSAAPASKAMRSAMVVVESVRACRAAGLKPRSSARCSRRVLATSSSSFAAAVNAESITRRAKPPASTAVCTATSVWLWFSMAKRARSKVRSMAWTRLALVALVDMVSSAFSARSSSSRACTPSEGTLATATSRFSMARS